MTFANNLDPDEAPQNVGLRLRSKLFDIQIIYQQKRWVETMNFLKILKETEEMLGVMCGCQGCAKARLPWHLVWNVVSESV